MNSHTKYSQVWIIVMCCILLFPFSIVSCNRGDNLDTETDSSESQEEPIDPADPTATLEQSTQTATDEPPTPTETTAINATVNVASLRVREGPGTNTQLVAGLRFGNPITLVGRNGDGTWVKFDQGWVAAEFLFTEQEIYLLPIVTGELDTLFTLTPKPTHTFTPTFTPSYTLSLTSTPTGTMTLTPSATIVNTSTETPTEDPSETVFPSETPKLPTSTP